MVQLKSEWVKQFWITPSRMSLWSCATSSEGAVNPMSKWDMGTTYINLIWEGGRSIIMYPRTVAATVERAIKLTANRLISGRLFTSSILPSKLYRKSPIKCLWQEPFTGLTISTSSLAESSNAYWNRTYGTPDYDEASCVIQTNDGDFFHFFCITLF